MVAFCRISATGILEVGDFLIDVDGIQIVNIEQMRQLFALGMKTRNFCSVLIRRPMMEASLSYVRWAQFLLLRL